MKKLLLATSVLAFTAAMPLAASAITLNLGASVSGSGGLSVGKSGVGANTSTSVTASLDGSANGNDSAVTKGSASGSGAAMLAENTSINSVVDAFASSQAALNAIASLQDDTVVDVIRIGTVASANADTFASAASENAQSTAQLQAAINANADFKAQLEGNDVSVDSIVAANVTADGALVLYSNSNG